MENNKPPYSIGICLFSCCDMTTSKFPILILFGAHNVIGQRTTMSSTFVANKQMFFRYVIIDAYECIV